MDGSGRLRYTPNWSTVSIIREGNQFWYPPEDGKNDENANVARAGVHELGREESKLEGACGKITD